MVKTKSRVREVVWWPEMSNNIGQMISMCENVPGFKGRTDTSDDVISIAPYQGTVPICGHADIEERQQIINKDTEH